MFTYSKLYNYLRTDFDSILEKFTKHGSLPYNIRMSYTDCHIHLAQTTGWEPLAGTIFPVCASAYTIQDYEKTEQIASRYNTEQKKVCLSFGIHPQITEDNLLDFLNGLLKENRLDAVGEIGFDFYKKEDEANADTQEYFWNEQLALAVNYKKPVIIHCRKALPKLFTYTDKMKNLPAVVFHSWNGSLTEADSMLKKGINAYFSIGKQVLNGNKKVIEAAAMMPVERLLTETDAPYQTLKNETQTTAADVMKVCKKIAELRQTDEEELADSVYWNFCSAFSISGIRS